jgi:hypothetical protein
MATGAVKILTTGDTTGAGLDQVVDDLNTVFATGRLRIFDIIRDSGKKDNITGGNIVVRVLYEEILPPPPAPVASGNFYRAVGFQGSHDEVQAAYEVFFPNGTPLKPYKIVDLTDLENSAATPLRLLVVYTDGLADNPLHGHLPEHLLMVRAEEDILPGQPGSVTYLRPDGTGAGSGVALNVHPTVTAEVGVSHYAVMDPNSNLVYLLPSCCGNIIPPPPDPMFAGPGNNQALGIALYTLDGVVVEEGTGNPDPILVAKEEYPNIRLFSIPVNNYGASVLQESTDRGLSWNNSIFTQPDVSSYAGGATLATYGQPPQLFITSRQIYNYDPNVNGSIIWFEDFGSLQDFPALTVAGLPYPTPWDWSLNACYRLYNGDVMIFGWEATHAYPIVLLADKYMNLIPAITRVTTLEAYNPGYFFRAAFSYDALGNGYGVAVGRDALGSPLVMVMGVSNPQSWAPADITSAMANLALALPGPYTTRHVETDGNGVWLVGVFCVNGGSGAYGFIRSDDNGTTWTFVGNIPLGTGIANFGDNFDPEVTLAYRKGLSNTWIMTFGVLGRSFYSTDNGGTWVGHEDTNPESFAQVIAVQQLPHNELEI